MSKIAATFSGKFGDILWSLPTVRQLSEKHRKTLDFYCMPQYRSLIPLLQRQPYIYKANVLENWICTGSSHGDQPAIPQNIDSFKDEYEHIYHLTYTGHPGINAPTMALIDFIAWQHNFQLNTPLKPWVNETDQWYLIPETVHDKAIVELAEKHSYRLGDFIAYAFNPEYQTEKCTFMTQVLQAESTGFAINVGELSWRIAAALIKMSAGFVGCRSSNFVLAHAVGQRNIFTYEPNPSRHIMGRFGPVFGNPYGAELSAPINVRPNEAAELAIHWINIWKKEKANVADKTSARGNR